MLPLQKFIARLSAFAIACAQLSPVWARGNGGSAGLSLLEAPSARAYAVAETMSAISNDISGFAYNPASLGSLRTGQASFLYQQGLVDDSYGHLMVGRPTANGGLGLSVGYYNGGDMEIFDGGARRTVTAQRDLTVSLGTAGRIGRFGWGLAGKYLSSELIERAKATGYAADLGVSFAATKRLQLGAAVQNLGPKLTYIEEGDDLPRIARLGAALAMPRGGFTTTLLADASYRLVEEDFQPSLGVEVSLGGLSLRTGVRQRAGELEITAGTGFMLGGTSIDYSMGVAQNIDTAHRISYSFRFGSGGGRIPTPLFVRATPSIHPPMAEKNPPARPTLEKPTPSTVTAPRKAAPAIAAAPSRTVYRIDQVSSLRRTMTTYVIRPGDTLASIAKDHYGNYRLWQRIYGANKHLISNPRDVEVGQKIVLP